MELAVRTLVDGTWDAPLPDWDGDRTLVLLFGASAFFDDPATIHAAQRHFRNSAIVGCSTAGEIHHARLRDRSVVIAVTRFEHTALRAAFVEMGASHSARAAGTELGRQLAHGVPRAVLVFSDGLHVNGSELVAGLTSALPKQTIVTGGLAGDGVDFHRTWVVGPDGPQIRSICAVGLYGDRVHVGHGHKGGWDIFGPERRVTRAEGNVLFELDDKPALDLYKQYLGDRAKGLPATALLFPLALRGADGQPQVVRTILSVDEERSAMVFAGDVPVGHLAQLMKANFDRLIDGAGGAARMATQGDVDSAVLSVAISCVGRRLVLGERAEEELEATLEVLSPGTRQVGFYSYGEISPSGHTQGCELHNQTMTLTTIREV